MNDIQVNVNVPVKPAPEKNLKELADSIVELEQNIQNISSFIAIEAPRSGTIRPSADLIYVGFQFFDMNLGKPIFAKEINEDVVTWVDALGNDIDTQYQIVTGEP